MSEKSIAQKLYIRENFHILILNEPDGYSEQMGGLPANVNVETGPDSPPYDHIQLFIRSMHELEEKLLSVKSMLKPDALLWVAYPKGTSKIKTDVNRDIIWKYAEPLGLKPVAMISIDNTWSSMRFKLID